MIFFVDKHLVGPIQRKYMNAMKVVYEMFKSGNEYDEMGLLLYDEHVEVEICFEEIRIQRSVKKLSIEDLYCSINEFDLSTSNNVFSALCNTFQGQGDHLQRIFQNPNVQRYIVFFASQY